MDPRSEVPPPEGQPAEASPPKADEKAVFDTEGTSTTTPSAADEKKQAEKAASDPEPSTELEAALQKLPEDERRIIEEQLDAPNVSVSFFSLYRYASGWDYVIIFISTLCAIAGGAALPLFTAS